MVRIHFHESFYQDVLLGRKVQTARIDEPHYTLGRAMADFSNGQSLPIEIINISFKTIDNMSLEEVQRDGFESKESLWKALMGFYPNLKVENSLMLVEFRCIVD